MGTREDKKRATLKNHLHEQIEYRRKYHKSDFYMANVLLLAGVLASFLGAPAIALTYVHGWLAAALVATPGLILLIQRAFSPYDRAQWNQRYQIELEFLFRMLDLEDAPVDQVNGMLIRLDRLMHENYPQGKYALPEIEEALSPVGEPDVAASSA